MSEPLCDLSGGEIRTAPLAATLIEALRARATGELRIDAHGGTSRVYLRAGQPCGAQIFFGFKPLGQFLLELGWIDIEALERSLAAVVDGKKQGEALVELGYLDRERLLQGLALHHQRHIRTLAAVAEGTYSFTPLRELPAWTDELRISAHRAIVDALATEPGLAVARKILARLPAGLGVRLRTGWDRYVGHFQLDAAEQALLAAIDRPYPLASLLENPHLAGDRTLALLAALFHMGVVLAAPLGGEELVGPWSTPGPAWPMTPGPLPKSGSGSPGPGSAAAGGEGPSPGPFGRTQPLWRPVAPPAEPAGTAKEIDPFADPFEPGAEAPPPPARYEVWSGEAEVVRHDERQELERQMRRAQEEARRIQAEREAAARAAREEALRRPAPTFKSDEREARERRGRLLQRAFGNIPGSPMGTRREDTPAPANAIGAAARPQRPRGPVPDAGDPAFAGYLEARLRSVGAEDHFERLGVRRTATRDEIKHAFFAAAKRFHPDRIPPAVEHLAPRMKELFSALNEAYQVLQDDERREAYLARLEREAARGLTQKQEEELRLLEHKIGVAIKQRSFADARKLLGQALALEDRADLRAHLAWVGYGERGSEGAAAAREELEAVVANAPRCTQAHYYLGVLGRVGGDLPRAEASFRKALECDPGHREAGQELRLIELRNAKRR